MINTCVDIGEAPVQKLLQTIDQPPVPFIFPENDLQPIHELSFGTPDPPCLKVGGNKNFIIRSSAEEDLLGILSGCEEVPEELSLLTRKISTASDEQEESKDSRHLSPYQGGKSGWEKVPDQLQGVPLPFVEDAGTEASMNGLDFCPTSNDHSQIKQNKLLG